MRCVIFDLDGTLADTSGDLIAAANACFRALGHGDMLDHAKDAGTALRGGRAMLTLGFERLGGVDDGLIDAQYPVLLDAYDKAIDHHTVLYPGAREAVDRLKAADYKVGICTNKPIHLAEKLLKNIEFFEVFDAVIGAGSLPVRKPDPAPYIAAVRESGGALNRSLLVGDTLTDRSTSKAAGVPSLLVTFSPEGQAVSRWNPEALLHHFDDIDEIVADLIG